MRLRRISGQRAHDLPCRARHFRGRQAAAFPRVMRSLRSSTSMPITRSSLSKSSMIPGAPSCVSTDLTPSEPNQTNHRVSLWVIGSSDDRRAPAIEVHCDDERDIIAPGSMHNPQHPASVFRDRLSGSTSPRRSALRRASVPSSSAPISREYPATSAAKIAARRRVAAISFSRLD